MPHSKPQFILMMGVSGVGKTTIGQAVANRLNYTFLDADVFHSKESREKMTNGHPLTDTDRLPWLERIHSRVSEQVKQGNPILLACSALKENYRKILLENLWDSSKVVWLDASRETLQKRTEQRPGHFMAASLLESQIETLEAPSDAIRIDANQGIEETLHEIVRSIEQPSIQKP